jgi:hypothetical protein
MITYKLNLVKEENGIRTMERNDVSIQAADGSSPELMVWMALYPFKLHDQPATFSEDGNMMTIHVQSGEIVEVFKP